MALGPLLAAAVAVLPCACSKGALSGLGGECNVVTDCQPGLVCIAQKNGSSICSNNLGSVQQLPPIPDAGTSDAQAAEGDASGDDGSGILTPDDAGTTTTADTGAPTTLDASGD